ncbi:MAG TPA: polysaccharide biosynthesis protein, partial [Ruminococcus sp.]|nr:polysaccharide biosynthesis protein [Ruminococcus sp.]
MHKNNIARDTFILTAVQIFLQVLALMLNIFITRELGASSVGVTSLIYSFFGFISVISNGNIFVCVSRFAAEEIGKPNGNPERIFSYSIIFCMALSITAAVSVFIFAGTLGEHFLKTPDSVIPIRIMSVCLPISALTSCIKGYFNAYRKVVF